MPFLFSAECVCAFLLCFRLLDWLPYEEKPASLRNAAIHISSCNACVRFFCSTVSFIRPGIGNRIVSDSMRVWQTRGGDDIDAKEFLCGTRSCWRQFNASQAVALLNSRFFSSWQSNHYENIFPHHPQEAHRISIHRRLVFIQIRSDHFAPISFQSSVTVAFRLFFMWFFSSSGLTFSSCFGKALVIHVIIDVSLLFLYCAIFFLCGRP